MEQIRLQKYISECGVMSRRAAEKEIDKGTITVNGEPVELGRVIDPSRDIVKFKGRVVKKKRTDHDVYLVLNKPAGYVTTMSDEKRRKCVASLVADVNCRVYPVGRLDLASEGLLIMTNDGDLANKLMHPRHNIPKIYHVRVKGAVTKEQLNILSGEMTIDGYQIQPVKCEKITTRYENTTIQMTLYEGRNRQIRKMCEQAGLEVLRLRRIAIGEIMLDDLKSGKWRYLSKSQVDYLKKA